VFRNDRHTAIVIRPRLGISKTTMTLELWTIIVSSTTARVPNIVQDKLKLRENNRNCEFLLPVVKALHLSHLSFIDAKQTQDGPRGAAFDVVVPLGCAILADGLETLFSESSSAFEICIIFPQKPSSSAKEDTLTKKSQLASSYFKLLEQARLKEAFIYVYIYIGLGFRSAFQKQDGNYWKNQWTRLRGSILKPNF
jgi:hypothetical protein